VGTFTREEWRTWVLRRAVNATFRLGTANDAVALAQAAVRDDLPQSVRVEALEDLADWGHPPRRDKVAGLSRPLPPREVAPAREALAKVSPALLGPSANQIPGAIVVVAIRTAVALGLPDLEEPLAALARHRDAEVQAEAKRQLAARRTVNVPNLVEAAEHGSLPEQQAALAALGESADASALPPLVSWAVRLADGGLRPELHLDVLEAASRHAGAKSVEGTALRAALVRWTNSLPKDDSLAPYRVALRGGDAANGRKLFLERQDLACLRCHKLKGEGGEVGPELAGLGRTKGREYVLRSIVQPNAEIAAGFESVLIVLKDGAVHAGVLKSAADDELTIDSPEDGRVVLKQSDVATRERSLSPMPDGMAELMTRRELRDLIEALAE
jgi:quinoprotein glucose dehydrogenase